MSWPPHAVPCRTAAGERELKARTRTVGGRTRALLLMIDGRIPVSGLVAKTGGALEVDAALTELVEAGLVYVGGAGTPPPEPACVRAELLTVLREVLGADAERLAARLEQAPATREGLLEAVASCKKVIRLTIDRAKADRLAERCTAVLERF